MFKEFISLIHKIYHLRLVKPRKNFQFLHPNHHHHYYQNLFLKTNWNHKKIEIKIPNFCPRKIPIKTHFLKQICTTRESSSNK